MRDRPTELDVRAVAQLIPQRAGADDRKAALADAGEGVHERQHVLALVECADEQVEGRVALPAEAHARLAAVARAEKLHVDAAVDHVDLVGELGQLGHQPHAQPVGNGDHPARALRRAPRERLRQAAPLDVAHVGAVGCQDHGNAHGPGGAGCGGAGKRQEVPVHNIRPEPLRRALRVARQLQVLEPPEAALVDRDDLELVPLRLELAADLGDEGPEVGLRLARPHLADYENLHV